MMSYRKHSDGTMSALQRGRSSGPPKGYTVDPKDPNHYIPILDDCYNRLYREEKVPCCGLITRMFCEALDGAPICYKSCLTCNIDTLNERAEMLGIDTEDPNDNS